MLLEEHEKQRFKEWLETQIHSSTLILEQMEKLGIPGLIQKEKAELMACKVVLNMITSSNKQSIG